MSRGAWGALKSAALFLREAVMWAKLPLDDVEIVVRFRHAGQAEHLERAITASIEPHDAGAMKPGGRLSWAGIPIKIEDQP